MLYELVRPAVARKITIDLQMWYRLCLSVGLNIKPVGSWLKCDANEFVKECISKSKHFEATVNEKYLKDSAKHECLA